MGKDSKSKKHKKEKKPKKEKSRKRDRDSSSDGSDSEEERQRLRAEKKVGGACCCCHLHLHQLKHVFLVYATSNVISLHQSGCYCCLADLQAKKVEEYWNQQAKKGGPTKCVPVELLRL